MGRAIRFGEALRFKRGSHWNHAFIVSDVERVGDGWVVRIIQAEPHGVTNDKTIDTVGEYTLVSPHPDQYRSEILAFAKSQVGSKYGWWSIVACIVDILTPDWFPSVRRNGTWICSALVGESLRFGGWLHNWPDIYTVTPAQLYEAYLNE